MLHYTREFTTRGPVGEVLDFAVRAGELASEIVDNRISVHLGGPGSPTTTLLFTSSWESRAQIAAGWEKLLADQRYGELSASGDRFWTGPGQDHLVQSLHLLGYSASTPTPVGANVITLKTVAQPGKLEAAVELGGETCELLNSEFDVPVGFGRSLSGTYGEMMWVMVCPSAEMVDQLDAFELQDSRFRALIDRAAEVFMPGSGYRRYATKIA